MIRHQLEIPMAKTNTAQITIQPTCKVAESFTEAVELAFLRRDAWLNHVLSAELPRIETELAGHGNSPAARRFIETQAASQERVAMTVSLDRRVAEQIRELCDNFGIVRDALFNRLFLTLRLPLNDWAAHLGIPAYALSAVADMPLNESQRFLIEGPLSLPQSLLEEPFEFHRAVLSYLRDYQDETQGDGAHTNWRDASLWKASFALAPSQTLSHLAAYDLVIPDSLVPGTEAWEERMSLGKQLLDRLKGL
jgi:hypothetical protein